MFCSMMPPSCLSAAAACLGSLPKLLCTALKMRNDVDNRCIEGSLASACPYRFHNGFIELVGVVLTVYNPALLAGLTNAQTRCAVHALYRWQVLSNLDPDRYWCKTRNVCIDDSNQGIML